MTDDPTDYGAVLVEAFDRASGHTPVQVNATALPVIESLRQRARDEHERKVIRILENDRLRDEIAQHRPSSGYVASDWQGRIAQHPLAAKEYLAWTRKCLAHLAEDERNTVSISRGHPLNRTQFHEEWLRKFDDRINEAGRVLVRESRDGWDLQRDKRTIEDYLQRRIRMKGLQSRLVNRRLPEMVEIAHRHRRGE